MHRRRSPLVLLALTAVYQYHSLSQVAGFTAPHLTPLHSSSLRPQSPEQLPVSYRTSSLDVSPRRAVFSWLRRAFFVAATTASTLPKISDAIADAGADAGPIVTLQFENLDGEEGKSGTVKIQLHPEWAPKGVDRFTVRTDVMLDHSAHPFH